MPTTFNIRYRNSDLLRIDTIKKKLDFVRGTTAVSYAIRTCPIPSRAEMDKFLLSEIQETSNTMGEITLSDTLLERLNKIQQKGKAKHRSMAVRYALASCPLPK
jgi:hypothetical protein